MPVELNKQCDALLCVLYREFLNRRAHGVPMDQAVAFSDGSSIRESLLPSWPVADVVFACKSLSAKCFLSLDCADENVIDIDLTDEALVFMEGRFHRRLESLLEYLGKIADLLPI